MSSLQTHESLRLELRCQIYLGDKGLENVREEYEKVCADFSTYKVTRTTHFQGTRQRGLPGFKMANLVRDVRILQEARDSDLKKLVPKPKIC